MQRSKIKMITGLLLISIIFMFVCFSCRTFHYEIKGDIVLYHFLNGIGLYYWDTKLVEDIDINSFVQFKNKRYGKDKNNVYFDGEIIEEADLESFETLYFAYITNDNFAKDKNHVYIGSKIWDVPDSKTFEILKPFYYSKDKNHVYNGKLIIRGANPREFKVIHGNYSKDDKDVYYQTTPLNVCNIKSFKILYGKQFDWFAKDKCSYYYLGKKVSDEFYRTYKYKKR